MLWFAETILSPKSIPTKFEGCYQVNPFFVEDERGNFVKTYNVDNFTDTNGNPLPQTDIVPKSVPVERLLFAELTKGYILVCKTGRYKTMIEGAKYKIEELKIKEIEFNKISQISKQIGASDARRETAHRAAQQCTRARRNARATCARAVAARAGV